jgi:hypothetical protein
MIVGSKSLDLGLQRNIAFVFAIQLSLCFVIKSAINWIYHNYSSSSLFYRTNFKIYCLSHILFKWNKGKLILELFFKGLHTYINIKTYKISDNSKNNNYKFHCLITSHKIVLHQKIWLNKLQHLFKQFFFMKNIIFKKSFFLINNKIDTNVSY